MHAVFCPVSATSATTWCLVLSAAFLRGNGVTRRTQKVIHLGRGQRAWSRARDLGNMP